MLLSTGVNERMSFLFKFSLHCWNGNVWIGAFFSIWLRKTYKTGIMQCDDKKIFIPNTIELETIVFFLFSYLAVSLRNKYFPSVSQMVWIDAFFLNFDLKLSSDSSDCVGFLYVTGRAVYRNNSQVCVVSIQILPSKWADLFFLDRVPGMKMLSTFLQFLVNSSLVEHCQRGHRRLRAVTSAGNVTWS